MTDRGTLLPRFTRRLARAIRPAHIVLAMTVAAISCFHGEQPPKVHPRNTLSLGAEAGQEHVSEQPFGVVFGAPRGETSDQVDVTLVFNRPMRPMDLAEHQRDAPARMKPDVPGSWRWIGSRALYFAPETKLPLATAFELSVPAGTRALDGSALDKDYVLQFSTPRPRLVSSSPWDGATGLKPSADFTLRFNQPVQLAEMQRVLTLQVDGAKRSVPFEAQRPDPQNLKLAKLVPKTPLPLASTIWLSVDPSLTGAEGPLSAGATQKFRFETYGPLRLGQLDCSRDTPHGQCAPRSSISLPLTNPVKYADAKNAISVVPAIKLNWWDGADPDHTTQYISLDAPFQPARTYTIRVKGSLKDVHGQALGRDEVLQVRFDDLWPYAEIGVDGTFFEPNPTREIPVASVNVKGLDLVTAPLGDDSIGLFTWSNRTPSFETLARLPQAKADRLRPAAAPNLIAKHVVRPSEALGGDDKRGAMVIGMRYTARPGTKEEREVVNTALVQVTNLGISAKVSRFGSLVWVTSLSDGKPVPGAEVRVRRPRGTAPSDYVVRTDAHGIALIGAAHLTPARSRFENPLIIVRHGNDWAFRSADDLLNGWRYDVSADLHGKMAPFGMVFTERGVYRPGDTVRVKGILREEKPHGTSTPLNKPVLVKVSTPTGDTLASKTLTMSEFGTFALDVKVPGTAPLGSYELSATVGGSSSDGAHAYQSFDVAQYRPSEFKVGVEMDRRSYIRGDSAACTARGDYLFGAPMSNASVRTTITRGFTYFDVPKTDGFSTTDAVFTDDWSDQQPGAGGIHSGQAKLDAQGKHPVVAKLAMPGQRSTETVVCEAEVMDLSRQTVASSSSAVVHPAEFYVAIRTAQEGFAKGGEHVTAQVLAVAPDGARKAGVRVSVELVRRAWVTARESAGRHGYHSASRPVDSVVSQCSTTTGSAAASCKLLVPKAGYYIVRGKATDPRGNTVAASQFVYALGDGESGWADRDDMRVELVPDRQSYEVGQTARILVKSPFREADALVTVERAGVYSHRTMKLTGSMPTVTIPITENFMPNAYVSVVMLRGRTTAPPAQWNAPDVGAPAFRVGYASLRVNPEARRLKVDVSSNKHDYRPGENVDVNLHVRDRAGKGARTEITLFAVDEGVLMLTGYKTPDPIPIFTEPRPLRVGMLETRADLARLTLSPLQSTVGQDKGLDGGGGGDGARKDFRSSAYFNPSVVTDEAGRAKVSFRLPDGLTSYRIMAVVAGTDDRFGFGESRVTTSLPLMARPAFPRLLRAGDEIDAGVVVTSKNMARCRVDVRATIHGLELVGDAYKAIELD
ncbi:MAG: MG2 domain-containing protein, partial [Polyangiaceae bacterium]|nr:MG2 domain-containing protein [Polyangiaceae bacterium]